MRASTALKLDLSHIIARCLQQIGVSLVTFVPGYGGTETFNAINELFPQPFALSFHEEVAFTMAHSASILGKRTACLMKTHGFGKAANSILHSLSAGTNGGSVIFLFDDPEGAHSDNILEIEPLLLASGLPFKKSSAATIQNDIYQAYATSEKLQLPHILLLDCREMSTITLLDETWQIADCTNVYERNPWQYVVCPFASQHQHQVLKAKQTGKNWKDLTIPNKQLADCKLSEVQGTWVEKYKTFFEVFKTFRGQLVTGDASTASIFALPPYNCIDIVTYLGGSTPLAVGAHLAGYKDTWAVTGDFSFIAAGHLGLLEATYRKLPLKLIIFKNEKAGATGGQNIQKGLLETVLAPYKPFVKELKDPMDAQKIEQLLKQMQEAHELSILVLDYAGG